MSGAVFACEIDGKAEADASFRLKALVLAAIAWKVDAVLYVDAKDLIKRFQPHQPGYPVERIDSLQQAIDLCPDHAVIGVEQGATAKLGSFAHPDQALYLFGGDRGRGLKRRDYPDATWIEIPGTRSIYGFQGAAIVAWDRAQQRRAL